MLLPLKLGSCQAFLTFEMARGTLYAAYTCICEMMDRPVSIALLMIAVQCPYRVPIRAHA